MNPCTTTEQYAADREFERRLHHAEFLRHHPEFAEPRGVRDLGQLIAADENIDPALREFFKLRDDKHNLRKFSAEPVAVTGFGDSL
jgi:hypothetical protein